ncbi:hypothetical protein AX16_001737 [Volvariella volvacea WC 439]|nr:hypothetical protein AX16_001737 [Volvariella volvacea WC 439]
MHSGFSLNRKITLRIQVTVPYDGPSLSDTSSLASLEEYRQRNPSQLSFSLDSSSNLDDDAKTVSSHNKDSGINLDGSIIESNISPNTSSGSNSTANRRQNVTTGKQPVRGDTASGILDGHSGSGSVIEDSSAPFARLKLQEQLAEDDASERYGNLAGSSRGAAWLREQKKHGLGVFSATDSGSSIGSSYLEADDSLDGDLALERDSRGGYHYTYTPRAQGSKYEQGYSVVSEDEHRPDSRLSFEMVYQQEFRDSASQVYPESNGTNLEDEFLQEWESPAGPPPPDTLTYCSACGSALVTIRYICSTCGERPPPLSLETQSISQDPFADFASRYPPANGSIRSNSSSSLFSWAGTTSTDESYPLVPIRSSVSTPSTPTLASAFTKGYELCHACLGTAGVEHAIQSGLRPATTNSASDIASLSPVDEQQALQRRKTAPIKGQLRHAYQEKIWGRNRWEDVEVDQDQNSKCSTCGVATTEIRFKCATCDNFYLCRACYSQTHSLHPAHAFIVVLDKVKMGLSAQTLASQNGEQSLAHGVRCSACTQEIVGPRFHCVVCPSIDICSNCEITGTYVTDEQHEDSHMLLKIPYPLERPEFETARQRAMDRWITRDASRSDLRFESPALSDISGYAQTVIGPKRSRSNSADNDHQIPCNHCNRNIIGVRYQCAMCPPSIMPYNLCSECEVISYSVHNSTHIFFKYPRPIHRQLESTHPLLPPLYLEPVGPKTASELLDRDGKAYLKNVKHKTALCDICYVHITGEWFHCVYCARDVCDEHEPMDTHDKTHIFMVLKAPVNMRAFKNIAQLELDEDNPVQLPPIIPYPLYLH